MAPNSSRRAGIVYNDSSATLYLKFGSSASTSSFTVKITANSYFEFPNPIYTGTVHGIWDSATGNARITEMS
jgi:hypothetical protein